MNDTYIDVYNPIFEVLQEFNTIHFIKDRLNPAQQEFVKRCTAQQKGQPVTWSKYIN
jgi:hypothetical protein